MKLEVRAADSSVKRIKSCSFDSQLKNEETISASGFGNGKCELEIHTENLPAEGCHDSYKFKVVATGKVTDFHPSPGGQLIELAPGSYSSIHQYPADWNPAGVGTKEPFPEVKVDFEVTYKYDGDSLTAEGGEEFKPISDNRLVCWQNENTVRVRECYAMIKLKRTSLTQVIAEYHLDHHFDGYKLDKNTGKIIDKIQLDLAQGNANWNAENSSCHKKIENSGTVDGKKCPKQNHSECSK